MLLRGEVPLKIILVAHVRQKVSLLLRCLSTLETDHFGGLVQDVGDEEEVEKLGLEGDVVHYEELAVRVVVCQMLVVHQENDALARPGGRPDQQAEDLEDDGHEVHGLLLGGRLDHLDVGAESESIHYDDGQNHVVRDIIADRVHDFRAHHGQVRIESGNSLNHLAYTKNGEH